MKKKRFLYCFILILFLPAFISAQTLVETQFSAALGSGARAMGMGGAFIAIADDATAITWNPGGLGQIEQIEVSLVGSYYDFTRLEAAIPLGDYKTGTYFQAGESHTFDFVGITIPIRPFENSDFKLVLQYSYQRLINLNIETHINPHYFEAKIYKNGMEYLATGDEMFKENYKGGLDTHSLGMGFRITSWLNAGFSVNFWTNGYTGDYSKSRSFEMINLETGKKSTGEDEFTQTDDVSFQGTSFNLGVMLKILDNLNFGFMYKNKFVFTRKDNLNNKHNEIHYPYSLGFGIAYRPIENLTLTADFTNTGWAEGKIVTDEGEFYFPLMDLEYNPELQIESEKQHTTGQMRFGAEYIFILDDLLLALRSGFYLNRQYFSDANQVIPTYTGVTVGGGIVWNSLVLDGAIVYESGDYQSSRLSAFKSDFSYLKAIVSVIYRF